jgi:excisionase family DNA binding protein
VTAARRVDEVAPDIITVPEAARRMGMHAESVYRLARQGRFEPAVQIGSRWKVSVPRLERLLHGESPP